MPKKQISPPTPDLSARDRILLAAQDLFYQNGIRATGVDRIIADARVTKVTLYRHFPSKDDLIQAFLEGRHQTWIEWFQVSIAGFRDAQTPTARRDAPLDPVLSAAKEWFETPAFRGCAFANTVAELGTTVPAILKIAARHKRETADIIATLLPSDAQAVEVARAAMFALDGAIANAQTGSGATAAALASLEVLLAALSERYARLSHADGGKDRNGSVRPAAAQRRQSR